MPCARKEIVIQGEEAVFHCIARCVRRAFLCGFDRLSGKCFEHRREWIRARLSFLTQVFAIEVIAYAVMSNHLHSVIKVNPETAKGWSPEEVARRWRLLFPKRRDKKGRALPPNRAEIEEITNDRAKVEMYRERLSNISWFNRCLNENIARRANREDDCTGRFWEGRFKCQKLSNPTAVIACSAYVDLNPIRAGIAKTPEKSDHTSIQDRIFAKTGESPKRYKRWSKVPLMSIPAATSKLLSLEQYLTLVDLTGRLIVQGKASISKELEPILERLGLEQDVWLDCTQNIQKHFRRILGTATELELAAAKVGKCWFHGLSSARRIFSPRVASAAV